MTDTITEAITTALADLHKEFEKASSRNEAKYDGPSKAVERSICLIAAYSTAVEQVIAAFPAGTYITTNVVGDVSQTEERKIDVTGLTDPKPKFEKNVTGPSSEKAWR